MQSESVIANSMVESMPTIYVLTHCTILYTDPPVIGRSLAL